MENQLLVIFGASGDLTSRKLIPALFQLYNQHLLPANFAILGISRTDFTDEDFRKKITDDLIKANPKNDNNSESIHAFCRLIFYLSLETSDPGEYHKVKEKISELELNHNTEENCIYYMATPPGLFEPISAGLYENGLTKGERGWKRIIVEKPFGINLASAKLLNQHLLRCFSEDQIYRIDHYLGKETVQNVMVTRFSNGIFEPLWNRNYIHHVEITAAENIGVEGRGGYYDRSGALRDMIQNHLLQILSLIAMEPPTQIHALAIRNETLKVLQSIRPLYGRNVEKYVIRGQYSATEAGEIKYKAYREEKDVAPDSRTETYVALRLLIDNWRWGGVPFYIRTGKCLPTRVTEIVVHFKPTPHKLFCFDEGKSGSDNQLIIRIQPDEGILLKVSMKVPGAGFKIQDINMDFHYADLAQKNIPEAYQRLLLDCMQGDATLFARGDAIEQAWRIVDPILDAWKEKPEIPVYSYPAQTWGPLEANSIFDEKDTSWRFPCKNLVENGTYCKL